MGVALGMNHKSQAEEADSKGQMWSFKTSEVNPDTENRLVFAWSWEKDLNANLINGVSLGADETLCS